MIPNILRRMEGFLKLNLATIYFTNYYEINIFHWDVQKHVSYTVLHRSFLICDRIFFETTGIFLKFLYAIHIRHWKWYKQDQGVRLQRPTQAFWCIAVYGRVFLKSILTYLYCIKYNETSINHSGIQKHVSYKK